MTTKISAKQIQKGMNIKVSSIIDITEQLTNMINESFGWGTHSEEEKKMYQNRLDNNDVLEVQSGTIKKDSPILKVYDIDFSNSNSYYENSRLVTINEIKLKTDKGDVRISTRQKVQVI